MISVIFDCDGVLIDSEWLASRVEAELLRELGLHLSVEQVHELFLGKTVGGVLDIIAARRGAPLPPEFTYNWAFATARAFMQELKPIPFVRGVVESLRAAGHKLAVASQSPLERVRLSLEATGLAPLFGEHLYVTTMVARPKPAPDIYLLAAARLGSPPAGCRVVEESTARAVAARAPRLPARG